MKIWSLQALRFFAALSVVFFHAAGAVNFYTHQDGVLGLRGDRFGQAGVDVFFVLSGVIIAMTSKGITTRDFVIKRATRILPLYVAVAVPYLLAGVVSGGLGWRELTASLTLWPAFDRMVTPAMPIAWTLCFEALFYAATALVIWRPRLIWPLSAAFVVALATRSGPVTQFIGNPVILEFLIGVGLTRLPRTRYALLGIPLGLALLWFAGAEAYPTTTVLGNLEGVGGWQRVLYLGLPAVMVVWGAMQISLRPGRLSYLGDTSYALYLVHFPVVWTVCWLLCKFTAFPRDPIMIVAAAVSVLVGWRIHEVVEKPVLKFLRGQAASRRPALA